jgi:hypothetical protein
MPARKLKVYTRLITNITLNTASITVFHVETRGGPSDWVRVADASTRAELTVGRSRGCSLRFLAPVRTEGSISLFHVERHVCGALVADLFAVRLTSRSAREPTCTRTRECRWSAPQSLFA